MKHITAVLLVLFMAAGSLVVLGQTLADATPVTTPPTVASEAVPETAVYFYRPRRFVGFALKPSVFVDNVSVGRLSSGSVIKVAITPGTHQICSNDKGTGIELDVKGGQVYYVRIDMIVGAWKGHGAVTLVDPQQGKYEVKAATAQAPDPYGGQGIPGISR